MRNIWKLLAVLALAGGLAACNKDKGPDGPTDFSGGCEAVDLGLSVKCAAYNVGAQNVGGWGSYFAWGETKEKENYGWENEGDYKWGIPDWQLDNNGMTKYTPDTESGDGLKTLQPCDDAATANWGTKWRTPTLEEIKELLDETRCEWTWDAAKKGYTVKGLKTGNSIFLPAAGYYDGSDFIGAGVDGGYWSSSLNSDWFVCYLYCGSDEHGWYDNVLRCKGLSVRAVTEY